MPLKKVMATSVMVSALALGAAGSASAGDRVIKARDACDPASFNAALGAGACERSSRGSQISFDSLISSLMADGENPRWSFDRERTTVDRGDDVVVRFDRGGEAHTFTEVDHFGAGCVDEINQLIGRTGAPAGDCSQIEATYIGPLRTTMELDGLSRGTHRFQCLIHPWMESTVVVR